MSRELLVRILATKRDAYRSVFMDGDKPSAPGARVLADLRKFCHAAATTAVADKAGRLDPLAAAQLEGRRQVYLRIVQMSKANDDDIRAITERMNDHG